jgi:hypothetical protein
MRKTKVWDKNSRDYEDCKEHPDCFVVGCKYCHQSALDGVEMRLMDLHEEIKGLLAHGQWHTKYAHNGSKWGWTVGDFTVESPKKK